MIKLSFGDEYQVVMTDLEVIELRDFLIGKYPLGQEKLNSLFYKLDQGKSAVSKAVDAVKKGREKG